MELGTIIALIALGITVIANIVTIVIFLTRQSDNLVFLKQTFEESRKNVIATVNEYKDSMHKKFDEFKSDIDKQIERNQADIEKQIGRLESKQDKHNCLIERMVRVEDSSKSSHKRIDAITGYSDRGENSHEHI